MAAASGTGAARRDDPPADALRESEARFRNAFENAAVGMALVAPDGRWLRVNRKVSEIVGYQPEELLRLTFQDITHPEDLDIDLDFLNATIRGERDTYNIEKRYLRKDGSIVWVNLTVACFRTPDGAVDYFISVIEDVSEKKRMIEALADSESRFRAVQQTSPDGFMLLHALRNPDGAIEDFRLDFVNPGAERIVGRSASGLVGSTMRAEMPNNFQIGAFDKYVEVVETGQTWHAEIEYPRGAGPVWFRVTAAAVGDGFAVSFSDISDRKKAEQHREILLGELSHRVKNTLATVQTMASHTLREAGDLDTFRDAFVGRLMAISKCHDLLVDATRRDADISQLVRDQVMPYALSGSDQVTMSGPSLIFGAEASHTFGLVLHELATNAAKYGALSTESGRVDISWDRATDRGLLEAIVTWTETGGPPVAPPTRRGFGSLLIEQSLVYSLGGTAEIDYRPEGVQARFRFQKRDRGQA
ncbi:MAG: PAS domain S-box protein [Hyphomonas sp.]|nr:PAS domain S-box protein [Hyphomonas sp.]